MKARRRAVVWIAALVAVMLVAALAVVITCDPSGKPAGADAEVQLIRQLAAVDDPRLAECLDRSMVEIPAGEFVMGSDTGRPDERPERRVYLDAYSIDRYEVTNAQYQRFVAASEWDPPGYWPGGSYPPGQADVPVVGVGWKEANAYCEWAGKRLPTEAEWEKACRGSDGRVYPWGNRMRSGRANEGRALPEVRAGMWEEAWPLLVDPPADAVSPRIQPVASYPKGTSPYGVYDLVGNASEWVWDWYNWSGYDELPSVNPRVLGPEWNRCLRGSAWFAPYGDRIAGHDWNRCSARASSHAAHGDGRTGFRCAASVTSGAP